MTFHRHPGLLSSFRRKPQSQAPGGLRLAPKQQIYAPTTRKETLPPVRGVPAIAENPRQRAQLAGLPACYNDKQTLPPSPPPHPTEKATLMTTLAIEIDLPADHLLRQIMEALEAHPEARQPLLRVLLTEDFLVLPEQM